MISIDLKEKIFALYYGQTCINVRGGKFSMCGLWQGEVTDEFGHKGSIKEDALFLKSLSDITAEHAIEVARYATHLHDSVTWRAVKVKDGRVYISDTWTFDTSSKYFVHVGSFPLSGVFTETDGVVVKQDHFQFPLHAYDYLRSKGYALPAFGLSIEKLIAEGVFKLVN